MRRIMMLVVLLSAYSAVQAQLNIDKVKNIFGSKKETSKIPTYLQFLSRDDLRNRTSGSGAEVKVTNYIADQFSALLFKPYQGKFTHPFRIDQKNNLSENSYIRIFNQALQVGSDVIVPPFSGAGRFNAQALPSMPEPDNLWFVKFSEVGSDLNNKRGNGLEKIHRKAKEVIKNGAEAVMFVNDVGVAADFTNSFSEKKVILSKPVFLLNHTAYKKYLIQQARGKEWINVDYDFSKSSRRLEGHNVLGYWQNQTQQNVVICARLDKQAGINANSSGTAALLDLAGQINKTRLSKYNYILIGLSGTADGRLGAASAIKKLRLTPSNVNCVINIDDIGGLNNKNQLHISGVATSPDWEMVLGSFSRNFILSKVASPEVGYSNQMSFYNNKIPTINIFTKRRRGALANNAKGIQSIAASIGDMLQEIDRLTKFNFSKTKALPDTRKLNFEVNMGIEPDFAYGGDGLLIGTVKPQSPADYSSVKNGDVLVKMGDVDIHDMNDYVREITKFKKGDRVMIKVKRRGVEKQMLISFK